MPDRSSSPRGTILLCYDGSPDARAAIRRAGELLPGAHAVVLTVWQPFEPIAIRTPMAFGMSPGMPDIDEVDKASAETALKHAQEGTQLAQDSGLDAEPLTCRRDPTTAEAILNEAERLDAAAILMGSRGRAGVRSLILGSVSHGVIQRADRPVIIVPSPEIALSRARSRRQPRDTKAPSSGRHLRLTRH